MCVRNLMIKKFIKLRKLKDSKVKISCFFRIKVANYLLTLTIFMRIKAQVFFANTIGITANSANFF